MNKQILTNQKRVNILAGKNKDSKIQEEISPFHINFFSELQFLLIFT